MKLACVLLLLTTGCVDKTVISKGYRVGVVTKLSNKYHCHDHPWAWEGELAMLAGTNATGQNLGDAQAPTSIWKFSLGANPNPALLDQLKAVMGSQHRVQISYNQIVAADTCESESDYFAVEVADLERQQ